MSAQKKTKTYSIDELKKILQRLNTFYKVEDVNEAADLFAQGLLDSLILIQYVMAIESTYKIQIANEHINFDNFKTFEQVKSLLDSKYSG